MQIGDRFRNGGDGGGFGLWRRERSCGRPSGECKDLGSIDKSRSGTVSNKRLRPDRIGGEGSVQIMKQNRGSKVEAYGRIGIPPQEIMSTPNRLKGQAKKSNQTRVNSLLDEEIPKPAVPSKRHSTSIIARLMGLDPILPPQPLNREFKDVFEVRQTEKAERKNLVSPKGFKKSTQRDADVAKRLSTDENPRRSHEFGEALDLLDSRRDLLLKFLEEPNSLFKSQRKDLPEAKITILKSCVGERSKSKFDQKDDPGSLPTRIVVLKPSLHRVDQKPAESTGTSVDRQLTSERRARESRRSGRREALYELRESDGTHKARRSREIAREVTRHMKQAAEMRMMAHKEREPICPRGCSTLGEMLAFADVETSEMPSGSSPKSLHERIPERKIPGGFLKRSKSVPSSSAINGNLNSFERPGVDLQDLPKRGSRPFDSVRKAHVDYDRPPDNALTVEKSCSSGSCSSSSAVEKYCTVDSERKAGSKEISSITEEADQPSPISVLETHSESRSPPEESFERLSADLRELRLKLQLLKCQSADAGSDTMISSDEDGDEREEEEDPNMEFDYLEKALAEAGFRRGDWDEFFCGFFAPEAPICRDVFEKLEKTCYGEDSGRKSQRKLLFDTINVVLSDILAMNMELRPWVKKNCRADRRKSLTEETWELMCRRRREAVASGPNKFLEDPKWLDVIDDVDAIGREAERMIKDDLLQELVFDVFFL